MTEGMDRGWPAGLLGPPADITEPVATAAGGHSGLDAQGLRRYGRRRCVAE